ncbi:NAD(P)/FAD-dependent oxidoreductase [Rugamonas aquatica]|uniref:NADH dehydrogenase FAD-containing subunit n=1 Tax=Rugamonas aquatica TaxID=2743357 RepID=A0A6A7MY83_9BURK|nr:FAD-dependent oxidoreductase [Rugamonas aquatica]MQA37695.1 NADH dehydrogenase FAD-containing subunit [Rugamonas aquatica]
METIVILGGGAGGLELATRLGDTLGAGKRARVLLVDRYPGHFWKPLLHTVASGKCDPRVEELSFPAQAVEHDFEFIQGEVLCLDRAHQTITLAPRNRSGIDGVCRTIAYDKLVLALGAVTNFYSVPGAADHALTLDSVDDAEIFRRRFIDACIKAGEQKTQVDVVIVGGGATGVELAAELSNSARALAAYRVHTLNPETDIRISVIERGQHLLPQLHPQQANRAARQLRSLGIDVLTGTAVAQVTADAVIDAAGIAHRADLTLWAAGVEAPQLCATFGLAVNNLRQIVVDSSLCSTNDSQIYALGDCASYVCPIKGAAPPRAQVAHQQAMFLADLLSRRSGTPRPDFRYHDYGSLVSLGPQTAVGVLTGAVTGKSIRVGGATASLLYQLLYQKHLLNLHGTARVITQALVDWLRAKIVPPVKLY